MPGSRQLTGAVTAAGVFVDPGETQDVTTTVKLPWLETQAHRIIRTDNGKPVVLRGVNLSGLEYSEPGVTGFLDAAGIDEPQVRFLTRDLGCTILRLPLNQDWVLRGRGDFGAGAYLDSIDEVIRWAEQGGAYTLLDLQWLDADTERGGHRQFVAPLPDADSITLWQVLAERYRESPGVLFDLFNEPHNRLWGDPVPLRRPDGRRYWFPWKRRVTARDWQQWAMALALAIRGVHPKSLLFVSGLNWGYDLRGLHLPLPNIVYSTHVYPGKRPDWDAAFGRRSKEVPVFAAEFGGEQHNLRWGEELLRYLEEREMGWAAWSWRDWPHLQLEGKLTPFGELVASRLGNRCATV